MEILQQNLPANHGHIEPSEFPDFIGISTKKSFLFLSKIKSIGLQGSMDDYERRKLGIFNQLNFFSASYRNICSDFSFIQSLKPSLFCLANCHLTSLHQRFGFVLKQHLQKRCGTALLFYSLPVYNRHHLL